MMTNPSNQTKYQPYDGSPMVLHHTVGHFNHQPYDPLDIYITELYDIAKDIKEKKHYLVKTKNLCDKQEAEHTLKVTGNNAEIRKAKIYIEMEQLKQSIELCKTDIEILEREYRLIEEKIRAEQTKRKIIL